MKVTLICDGKAGGAAVLARVARAEGADVVQTLERAAQALQPLLALAEGDIVVVESLAPDADLSVLEGLTPTRPSLALILLAPHRDADLLLRAMRAGIREVLPNPPDAGEFAAALRRLAHHAQAGPAPARGRAISFVACKGGSGATFLATNLAYVLAAEFKLRVALLDMDLQYGDAAYFVSDQPVRTNLAELARQVDRLDASLLEASMMRIHENFSLLAAPEEPEDALGITSYQLERVIDVALANYDVVLLDVERMLDPLAIKALDKSQAVYLVTENMIPHVRDTRRLVRILHALGYPDSKLHLLLNRNDKRLGLDHAQVQKALGLEVAYTLPESPKEVSEAVNAGVPLVQVHPHSPIARGLREIARTLAPAAPANAARSWLARLVHESA